jgi:hypothetical protein
MVRLLEAESNQTKLQPGVQRELEARFGRSLDHLRIHAGPRAAKTAHLVGAEAYAAGNHIVFGAGKYRPDAVSGRQLLTHEVAHTLQMDGGAGGQGAAESRWESEARHAEAAPPGAQVQLSAAPAGVRAKLDPNLRNYLENLRALAREPGIGQQKLEAVADRIESALKGLDVQDQDNLAIVADELGRLFPGRVVTEFLVRCTSRPLHRAEPGPGQRMVEQTERRMQVGQPYKSGKHTPGMFFVSMFADALGSAVPAPPQALLGAVARGGSFVSGVYAGMSDSIEEEELRALVDKLERANLLSIAFPPIFLAGALYGIGEDAVDLVKSVIGLFQGELGQLLAVAVEALEVLMSPAGDKVAYELGKEVGRGFAHDLRKSLQQNLVHFTFSLGRFIGPTIAYVALTLAGVPQLIFARVFTRILPLLKRFLQNEARLLALVAKIEKRLPPAPARPQAVAPKPAEPLPPAAPMHEVLEPTAPPRVDPSAPASPKAVDVPEAPGEMVIEPTRTPPANAPPATFADDPRTLLSMEEQRKLVQYDPNLNREAAHRSAYRFTPKPGETHQFGPRRYTYDASGNLVEASTNDLTLGVRDKAMYSGTPGMKAGEDYGHLLGVDFGTIDAEVGRHGGFRQASWVNRPLGAQPAQWYNAERAALDEALRLKSAGQPYRVVAQAEEFVNGVPARTRIAVESNGAVTYDSGWIANPVVH